MATTHAPIARFPFRTVFPTAPLFLPSLIQRASPHSEQRFPDFSGIPTRLAEPAAALDVTNVL